MISDRKIGQIEDRRQEMLVKESSEFPYAGSVDHFGHRTEGILIAELGLVHATTGSMVEKASENPLRLVELYESLSRQRCGVGLRSPLYSSLNRSS